MSVQTVNPKTSPQDATPLADSHTRLYGRQLWLARAVWLAIVLLTVSLYLLSVPISYTKALTICTAADCDASQLTPKAIVELQQLGLPPNFLAAYFTFTNVFLVAVSVGVALVIFRRRSDDWLALLGSLMLVTFAIATFSGSLDVLAASYPDLAPVNGFINFCGAASLLLFFYLFPNGRFEPRWTRWLLLLVLVIGIMSTIFSTATGGNNDSGVFFVIPIASIIVVQTYRYWKVSGTVERQQTKWVVFGTTVALGGLLVLLLVFTLFGLTGETIQAPSVLVNMVVNAVFILLLSLIPVSLMIAILRYRLWEIDLLINRTLVYVPLTAILAGIFAATITLTQKLFIALTGQSSEAATVLTTLVVVAAFDPLKTGLQHFVDRHFKDVGDPTKRLKAYGDQLRGVLEVTRTQQSTQKLLEEAMAAFDANSGAVFLDLNGERKLVQSRGVWNGDATLTVSLQDGEEGKTVGAISLGPRRNGAGYSQQDRATLQGICNLVALAIEQDRQAENQGL